MFQSPCRSDFSVDMDVDTCIWSQEIAKRGNRVGINVDINVNTSIRERDATKFRYQGGSRSPAMCVCQSPEGRQGGHQVLRRRAAPERPARQSVHSLASLEYCGRGHPETAG